MKHPDFESLGGDKSESEIIFPKTLSPRVKLSPNWLQQFLSRLPIRQKIGLGYALALSIAVLGMATGKVVGNFYTKQALKKLDFAQNVAQLLSELKIAVMETESHQQKLVILVGNSKRFEREELDYMAHQKKVQHLFSKLKLLVSQNFNIPDTEIVGLDKFLKSYNATQTAYSQQMTGILRQIDPKRLQPEKVTDAQQLLWNFTKSKVAVEFDELSEDLTKLVNLAYKGQDRAESDLDTAEVINSKISIASILLSLLSATGLAVYISRAIAQPIEAVTKTAEKATKKSNFSVQAPVTTQDEVGALAISLNRLIQWVGEYIEALEISKQNLERRVEERTEELSQKNQELHSAYKQLEEVLQNLQQTQSQLIQAEKMSSLGQMVAGIAHEINNPVSFIYGNIEYAGNYAQDLLNLLELYQQEYPDPSTIIQAQTKAIDLDFLREDFRNIIDSMKNGADRIRQIVLSLRNFSRLDEADIKSANIHQGVENILLILNHRINNRIQVVKNRENLPLIDCYPALLNQVFMNIIDNAIAALEELTIKSPGKFATGSELPTIWIHTQVIDKDWIRVVIRDNGNGIHPEIKGKIFDPFFTTKDVGKGTGLGLTVCYQIIEKHKGKIEVFSELGQGTEFWVTLPIKQS